MDLASRLVSAGELQGATEEYVWLWKNMLAHRRSMVGVRTSFMASEMQRLAKQHPPALQAFKAIRDEEDAQLSAGEVTWERLGDWIALNGIIGDDDRTLAWFDRIKQRPESRETLRRQNPKLSELLESRGRYRDMVWLQPDSVLEARFGVGLARQLAAEDRALPASIPEPRRAEIQARMAESGRGRLARIYAIALLAGKTADAETVLEMFRKHDPSPAMLKTIVATCIRFTAANPEHAALLDEAEKAGVDVAELRVQLKAFLDQPPP